MGFTGKNAAKVVKRFNLRCRFSDVSDSVWLTTFHEAAEGVLAMKAENFEAYGRDELEEKIKSKYLAEPLQLTVRAKLGVWNGEPRPEISCVEARRVNRRDHGRALLKEIQQ